MSKDCCAHHTSHAELDEHPRHHAAVTEVITKDPVCGMIVDPDTAKFRATFDGQTYYFCSENCLRKFTANPRDHLPASTTPEGASEERQRGHWWQAIIGR